MGEVETNRVDCETFAFRHRGRLNAHVTELPVSSPNVTTIIAGRLFASMVFKETEQCF